jgi:hypothetical protein
MIPTQVVSSSLFRQFRTTPPLQIIRYPRPTLPHIRYFTSTSGLHTNRVTHSVGDGEKAKTEDDDYDEHRMINNNNPNPAISLPGGVSWPFSSNSSLDAALTTIIGLGLGENSSLFEPLLQRTNDSSQYSWVALHMSHGIKYVYLTK